MRYRSKFEKKIAGELLREGIPFDYEKTSFNYLVPIRGVCSDCGSHDLYQENWYTPDFFLGDGIIIEVKGKFLAKDRAKMLAVRELHPNIDWRMLFMRDNKFSPKSKTRYSMWAEQHEFPYCIGEISDDWIKEFKYGKGSEYISE